MIDRGRASELLVKPPNDMHGDLTREEMRVHEDKRPRSVVSCSMVNNLLKPIETGALAAGVHFVCTKLRAARVGTLCCILLLAKAWVYNMYALLVSTGTLFEMHRTSFRACVLCGGVLCANVHGM